MVKTTSNLAEYLNKIIVSTPKVTFYSYINFIFSDNSWALLE